jgi:hypothetical protein
MEHQLCAAFFPAFSFAHRALWNAAIFLREAADMVRFAGAEEAVFFSMEKGNCRYRSEAQARQR